MIKSHRITRRARIALSMLLLATSSADPLPSTFDPNGRMPRFVELARRINITILENELFLPFKKPWETLYQQIDDIVDCKKTIHLPDGVIACRVALTDTNNPVKVVLWKRNNNEKTMTKYFWFREYPEHMLDYTAPSVGWKLVTQPKCPSADCKPFMRMCENPMPPQNRLPRLAPSNIGIIVEIVEIINGTLKYKWALRHTSYTDIDYNNHIYDLLNPNDEIMKHAIPVMK